MSIRSRPRSSGRTRRAAAMASIVATVLVATAGACSNSEPDLQLTGAARAGQDVWDDKGCAGCHSVDGSSSSGPTFDGLFDRTVTLDDGSTVTADEDYLRESIADPSSKIVDGYAGIMPEIELTEKQVDDLIAFIEALR